MKRRRQRENDDGEGNGDEEVDHNSFDVKSYTVRRVNNKNNTNYDDADFSAFWEMNPTAKPMIGVFDGDLGAVSSSNSRRGTSKIATNATTALKANSGVSSAVAAAAAAASKRGSDFFRQFDAQCRKSQEKLEKQEKKEDRKQQRQQQQQQQQKQAAAAAPPPNSADARRQARFGTETASQSQTQQHQQHQQQSQRRQNSQQQQQQQQQPKRHHQHLEELVLQLTPTADECARRYEAFADVRQLLLARCGLHLYVFGSQRTGIALPSSDVDVVARSTPLRNEGHFSDDDDPSNSDDDDVKNEEERNNNDDESSSNDSQLSDDPFAPLNRTDQSATARALERTHRHQHQNQSHQHRHQQGHHRQQIGHQSTATSSTTSSSGGGAQEYLRQRELRENRSQHGGIQFLPNNGNGSNNGHPSSQILNTGRRRRAPNELYKVADILRRDRRFAQVRTIAHAKIPIVKVRHAKTGVEIDISFTDDGLFSSKYLSSQFDACSNEHKQPARALVVLMKAFVAALGVNDPSCGGVGSFVCSMLVLWFLARKREKAKQHQQQSSSRKLKRQHKQHQQQQQTNHEPQKQRDDFDQDDDQHEQEETLDDFWIDFLRFYVEEFDVSRRGVDCSSWTTFSKPHGEDLVLLNPLESSRNCASAATKFATVVLPAMERFLSLVDFESGNDRNNNNDSNNNNFNATRLSLADWILHPATTTNTTTSRNALMMRRWDDTTALRGSVSNVPALDKDGFFSALPY